MSCKSAIYAVNTSDGATLAAGSVYAPNQVVRRFGPSCQMAGNGITISGAGYYSIDATVTINASAAGAVTAALYLDGVGIPGAVGSAVAAAAGDAVTIPLTALVRLNCDCQESVITVVAVTAGTSNNLAINVEKE